MRFGLKSETGWRVRGTLSSPPFANHPGFALEFQLLSGLAGGFEKDAKEFALIVAAPDERASNRGCVADRDEAQAGAGELAK